MSQRSRLTTVLAPQNPRPSPTLPPRAPRQLADNSREPRHRPPPLWRGHHLPRPPAPRPRGRPKRHEPGPDDQRRRGSRQREKVKWHPGSVRRRQQRKPIGGREPSPAEFCRGGRAQGDAGEPGDGVFDCGERGVMRQPPFPPPPLYQRFPMTPRPGVRLESLFFSSLCSCFCSPSFRPFFPSPLCPTSSTMLRTPTLQHKSVDLPLASAEQDTHPPQNGATPLGERERERATTNPKKKKTEKKKKKKKRAIDRVLTTSISSGVKQHQQPQEGAASGQEIPRRRRRRKAG